jgi:ABC-type transporter Mla subunit MlaD
MAETTIDGPWSPEYLAAQESLSNKTTKPTIYESLGSIIGLIGAAAPVAGSVVDVVNKAKDPVQYANIEQQNAAKAAAIESEKTKQNYILYGLLGVIFLVIIVVVIVVNKKS